jgi:hypothetical protein
MWWDHMFSWPSWIAMTFMMTIALGGLALLIALALRAEFRPPAADPRRLLDARLARGEIDAPEYRERVSALTEVHDA